MLAAGVRLQCPASCELEAAQVRNELNAKAVGQASLPEAPHLGQEEAVRKLPTQKNMHGASVKGSKAALRYAHYDIINVVDTPAHAPKQY